MNIAVFENVCTNSQFVIIFHVFTRPFRCLSIVCCKLSFLTFVGIIFFRSSSPFRSINNFELDDDVIKSMFPKTKRFLIKIKIIKVVLFLIKIKQLNIKLIFLILLNLSIIVLYLNEAKQKSFQNFSSQNFTFAQRVNIFYENYTRNSQNQ